MSNELPIDFKSSFSRREPVLKAARIEYAVSEDGAYLTLKRSLSSYSKHEQDVIQFALNPIIGLSYFGGLDMGPAKATAEAIYETYTKHGGKWE